VIVAKAITEMRSLGKYVFVCNVRQHRLL